MKVYHPHIGDTILQIGNCTFKDARVTDFKEPNSVCIGKNKNGIDQWYKTSAVQSFRRGDKAYTFYQGEFREFEECTPTWLGILPVITTAYRNPNNISARREAYQQLEKMAGLADKYQELIDNPALDEVLKVLGLGRYDKR